MEKIKRVLIDQNSSYDITINGFQVKKIHEIRNLFSVSATLPSSGKPSSALMPKLGCSPSLLVDEIILWRKTLLE